MITSRAVATYGIVAAGIMLVVWLIFAWAVEQFGKEIASVAFFAISGVVLAVVLWISSGAYTAAVWREAHRHTETSARMTTELLRSTMPQQRVESTAQLVRERQLLLAMRNSRQLPQSAVRQTEDIASEIEVVEWK